MSLLKTICKELQLQIIHREDSVWQFPTTSTNHLSFPHTPIDRTTENFTHVLDDRILNNIHILRVRQEENVASKNQKVKELQSCTESCLSDPVLLHLAVVMPIRIHHRLCILHREQRKVTNDVKQCHVIAEGIKQGIATTNNMYMEKTLFDSFPLRAPTTSPSLTHQSIERQKISPMSSTTEFLTTSTSYECGERKMWHPKTEKSKSCRVAQNHACPIQSFFISQ